MKRVHILTFHNALNYGAVLQCIALYKTISQITECDVINYHSPKIDEVYKVFSFKRSLKNNVKGILLVLKTRWNKVPSALSTPLPLTHEGFWGFPLSLFVVKYS
ncbi:MAG: hypothetical protein KHZ57_25405, partial [Hungatella hathewayi]|nr:hypothetical protein [Hungatella hathewayi]